MDKKLSTEAALVELTDAQLDQVTGGKITVTEGPPVTTNPAGNVTSNNAGGQALTETIPITATNPAGHEPPGQQEPDLVFQPPR